LALESGAYLTFIRVMDAEFLQHATVAPLSVVYRELAEMARFAMLVLCDRAQRRGVKEVDYIVREGSIRSQLRDCAMAVAPSVMVMGCPVRSPGRNVFAPREFEDFVAHLESEAGLCVVQVSSLG
jgi:hypothetical protein